MKFQGTMVILDEKKSEEFRVDLYLITGINKMGQD